MIRLAAVIFVFLAQSAWAQTLTVRSGEHGSFTRLVVSLGDRDWSINRIARDRLKLSVPDRDVQYNTASVFDRIGQDRISALEADPDGLEIALACECVHEAFLVNGGFLVIDVREGDVPEFDATAISGTELPQTAPPKPVKPATTAEQRELQAALTKPRLGSLPGLGPRVDAAPLLPELNLSSSSVSRKPDPNPVAENIGAAILQNIARAATDGVLDANQPNPEVPESYSQDMMRGKEEDPVKEMGQGLDEQLAQSLSELGSGNGFISIGGETCTKEKHFRLSDWRSPAEDVFSIEAEETIFGELEKLNTKVLMKQVRAYLAIGFGAEARNLLSLTDKPKPELLALSYGVDGASDPNQTFAGQTGCDGSVAFWSVVTTELSPTQSFEANAILQSFELLPKDLREHLGPIVARKLTGAEQRDLAVNILRRLERAHGAETSATSLARTEIDLSKGNYEQVVETALELSRAPGPEAPDAVIALVEAAHEANLPIAEDVAQLSEAFAEEMKDHESGPSLWRAHVLTLLSAARFDDALTALNDAAGVPDALLEKTEMDLAAAFVSDASDFEFLQLAMSKQSPKASLRSEKLASDYIKRLVDLGVPDFALEEIAELPPRAKTREMAMIQAKALLDTGQAEAADMILIGMTGEDVLALRADVRSVMGDHEFAQSAYSELGNSARASDEAWLLGDWENLVQLEDSRGRAGELVLQDLPDVAAQIPTLADAEFLASQSAQTRSDLASLLAETALNDN